MTHVSSRKLAHSAEKKLYTQLADIFVAHSRPKDCQRLIYELFTDAERLMFGKRIAVIVLLERNHSFYSIAKALHVSESTVARIDARRQAGAYRQIVRTIKNKEHRQSFIGTLEAVLTAGLPGNVSKRFRDDIRRDIDAWRAGG